jgi:acyl transferase domain-containing protein
MSQQEVFPPLVSIKKQANPTFQRIWISEACRCHTNAPTPTHFCVLTASLRPTHTGTLEGCCSSEYAYSPTIAQLKRVYTQLALASYWKSLWVKSHVFLRHSPSEYAALYTAYVICASDNIFLVGKRSRIPEERCLGGTHKMMAVRAPSMPSSRARAVDTSR